MLCCAKLLTTKWLNQRRKKTLKKHTYETLKWLNQPPKKCLEKNRWKNACMIWAFLIFSAAISDTNEHLPTRHFCQDQFGQEIGKKLSAFKIRFLKTRHPFEDFEGSHYKMISAVHVTTQWKDQNMIFAGLRNIFSMCFLHLAFFRFTSDVSLGCRSPP